MKCDMAAGSIATMSPLEASGPGNSSGRPRSIDMDQEDHANSSDHLSISPIHDSSEPLMSTSVLIHRGEEMDSGETSPENRSEDVTMDMTPMTAVESIVDTPDGPLLVHHNHHHSQTRSDVHDIEADPQHLQHHPSLMVTAVGTVNGTIPGLNGPIVTTSTGQMMTTTTEAITATTENGTQQVIPEGTVVLMSIVPKAESLDDMDDVDEDGDQLMPRKQQLTATVVQGVNGEEGQGVTFIIQPANEEGLHHHHPESNGEVDGDVSSLSFIPSSFISKI